MTRAESHHATSKLSKEMLQNFNPSFVLDLTATPKKGSNIISFVDARQLKAENMVKLPVIVYNRKSQEDVFISAVSLRRKLELEAVQGQKNGGKYIRPIVLFQAQPKNNADSTTYEKIKHTLMEMGIPESEIAIKTANKDELKNIDLSSLDCNIRYIITINALKEGWDCPFAYILATVANRTSSIDVEQILGRILRLPNTKKNESEVLNLSYVITSSNAFYATLDKVVVGLNAAGFTSKDYRVDDCEDVVDERQTTQEVNSQTELLLDNIQVGNNDKDIDELDGLNVELMKMQLEKLENESAETGKEDSSVSSNAINDMLEHAKSQNELYWQEFQETEENYVPVPPEVGDKMKHYKLNQLFADEASSMEIPQFMIETGRSLFSEHVQQPLSKENLYAGFSLLDKDTVIDFDSVDSEIARIDIDDSDAMPKAWKLQGFDNQNVKKWFDEQPSDRKIRLCKDMIIKKLSKNNAVNDRDLDIYVDRIIQNLTEDQLTDMEQTPGIYALKINKKVNSLLNEYAKKMFYEWVEQDKISCMPSYKLPREISPTNTIASIPKSLYSEEENFDTEYERKVVMELSSLNNVRWWHRNIARKGFSINGAINAYPDLMVKTESGKLLLIETKGDQLENLESKEKAETGAKWAEMAGRMYKYYMVFETKNPGYNGAYSYEEFMRIVINIGNEKNVIQVYKLVATCLSEHIENIEKTFYLPSRIARILTGITYGDGYEYINDNNEVVCKYSDVSKGENNQQECLQINSHILESSLKENDYRMFWVFRVYRSPSSKAYELYGNDITHDTDRSYIVWFDEEKSRYIELKEIEPVIAENNNDYVLKVKSLYDGLDD